jgi:hypothetical protein
VRYIPRTEGDAQANELYTSAAAFMRDECGAEDEDTDAFLDTVICGMGWTESRLDFEEDPEGKYVSERIDPFEMVWASTARARNLSDSPRFWRVKDYPISEAMEMFPDHEPHELHASWASDLELGDDDEEHDADKRAAYLNDGLEVTSDPGDVVRIVHLQWCEKVKSIQATDPFTGEMIDLKPDEHKKLEKRLAELGQPPLKTRELTKKVWYCAFLGSKELDRYENACPDASTWECITGKRDQNEGIFIGLVESMKDPSRYANKWLSQSIHIMNLNAKGGLLAERGAFEDDNQAEETYADPSRFTWVAPGALSGQNPRIKEKVQPPLPNGPEKFLEYAVSSIRDVSGVNLELLGLQDHEQAGVLEAQRKQAGMTILAHLFDNLKKYRRRTGRTLLYYINKYLSDGRLVRILGEENEQFVPLMRQYPDTMRFDVIIDDSPTSPNNKEMVWNSVLQIIPMIGKALPPQALVSLMKFSPLPSKVVADFEKSIEEAAQAAAQQPDPATMKAQADIQVKQMEGQIKERESQREAQNDRERLQMELVMEREKLEFEREKHRMEMEALAAKLHADMQKTRMEQEAKQAELSMGLQFKELEHEVGMRVKEHDAGLKERDMEKSHEFKEKEHKLKVAESKAKTAPEESKPQKRRLKVIRDKEGRISGAEEH